MKFSRISIILLSALAIVQLLQFGLKVSEAYKPLDFRTYSFASEAAIMGLNPYTDSAQESVRVLEDNLMPHTPIGFPHAVTVYAPGFVTLFSPYTLFSNFRSSAYFHALIQILAFVLIFLLLKKMNPEIKPWLILALLLGFRGTWYAALNGQPLIEISCLLLAAIYFSHFKKKEILAGVLLGLCSIKFTIIIPFVIWFINTNKYKGLVAVIVVSCGIHLPYLILYPQYLDSWFSNMNHLYDYIHCGEINSLNIINTGVSVPLHLLGINHGIIKLFLPILLLLSMFALGTRYTHQKIEPLNLLFLLSFTGFIFGQHLFYDLTLLLCLGIVMIGSKNLSTLYQIVLAILFLPIGKIAELLKLPEFNFVVPIFLILLFILELKKVYEAHIV